MKLQTMDADKTGYRGLDALARRMIGSESGYGSYAKSDGTSLVTYWARVPSSPGWTLGLSVSSSEVGSTVSSLLGLMLGVLAAGLAVAIVLSLLLARSIVQPIQIVAESMLGRESRSISLSDMLRAPAADWSPSMAAPLVLVALGLFMVLLAEACRIPVDDPNTHLELTMIHEAMVLDHGGPLLGAISYSASMKLLILGSILLHVVCPFRADSAAAEWALFVGELLALSFVIGTVESFMARLRMNRVPYFLAGALLCCGGGLILFAR